ncbi:MAG: alpha-1,2-fucosyltransferase [Candidatus Fonsibacter ubiquis]
MISNNDLGNLGRLGNQMFQYSALIGLSKKHNYDYCLPPREIVGTLDPNVGNSDTTLFETFKISEAPRHLTNFSRVYESIPGFDESLWENCPDNVNLHGYFQTEKYFKHVESDLRKEFIFVDDIFEPSQENFKSLFGNSEVISIHVRRGDYLLSDGHIKQTSDYYKRAIDILPKEIPIIIFSDGIDWCKDQKVFEGERFVFSENNNTSVDLCLQSLCSYHIICNSSFSWWGSWLAKSKKTIAPSKWFNQPNEKNNDIYVQDWTVLNSMI